MQKGYDISTQHIYDIDMNQPHKVSEVICVKCYKRWIAVRPQGTLLKDLECPNCGSGYVIETGEEINKQTLKGE